MTLTEFRNRPSQNAEAEGFVILEKGEYQLAAWDDNDEADIIIKDEDKEEGSNDRDRFYIKKGNPIVYMDSVWFTFLGSVYAVKLEDV